MVQRLPKHGHETLPARELVVVGRPKKVHQVLKLKKKKSNLTEVSLEQGH